MAAMVLKIFYSSEYQSHGNAHLLAAVNLLNGNISLAVCYTDQMQNLSYMLLIFKFLAALKNKES